MGESLGTGVATIIASRHEAAALVLDAPYFSALDVAGDRYPIFPVGLVMRDTFRSDLAIADVHMPVLMMHGEEDSIIPIASGRKLFELAHEPKQFIAVPGAGHLVMGLDGVYPRVKAFIDANRVGAR
jgi:pimeloyl-ACP methyl ester carboxylesterase